MSRVKEVLYGLMQLYLNLITIFFLIPFAIYIWFFGCLVTKTAWKLSDNFDYNTTLYWSFDVQIYEAELKDDAMFKGVGDYSFAGDYYGLNEILSYNGISFDNKYYKSFRSCSRFISRYGRSESDNCLSQLLEKGQVYIIYIKDKKQLFIISGEGYGGD